MKTLTALMFGLLINQKAMSVSPETMACLKKMFENAVQTYFGTSFGDNYFAVTMNGVLYQRRPLRAGNAGVKLEFVGGNAIGVALYEAQILGLRHRQTNAQAFNVMAADWEKWSKAIRDQWEKELR